MASGGDEADLFMQGPLVIWLQSCLDDPHTLTYDNLLDGTVLYQVLLKIDPEPPFTGVQSTGVPSLRIQNLEIIFRNLRVLYKEELGQVIVAVPDIVRLGADTNKSPEAQKDLTLLILLLLAFAVQSPNKELFINKITSLPIDTQHAIVEHIKQFTDTAEIVLGNDAEHTVPRELLLEHLHRLIEERDSLLARCAVVAASSDFRQDRKEAAASSSNVNKVKNADAGTTTSTSAESHHFAVELADWKAKFRRQRQELEEKTEALTESREEVDALRHEQTRLRAEVAQVVAEARTAKAYRDEADAMREKAERAEQLDAELQRFKDKLADVEFYKARVQELRDDNRVLIETRETLEEQLARAKRRAELVTELESEILKLRQQFNDVVLERESQDKKLEELYRERAELQLVAQAAHRAAASETNETVASSAEVGEDSLSSQLSSSATARALRLELENRKLLAQVEELRDNAHDAGARILELERDSKRITLNLTQCEEQCRRLRHDNEELESVLKESLAENKQLQAAREGARSSADRLQAELTSVRDAADSAQAELGRMRGHAEELERIKTECADARAESEELRKDLVDLRAAQLTGGKEVATAQRDLAKIKRILEEKDREIDELKDEVDDISKQRDQFKDELMISREVSQKLHTVERENEELNCKLNVTQEALTALEKNLVQQKVENQQLKAGLDKLGVRAEQLLQTDISSIRDLLINTTESCRKCELSTQERPCQQCADFATLQVRVASLQSQNMSLTAQHTALQLANTQLVAEKEQVEEERRTELSGRQQLMTDLASLRQLHEQLSAEHEALKLRYDTLRATQRDTSRDLAQLRDDARSLANLRAEHARLRSDFKELFGSNQTLLHKYTALQEHFNNVRGQTLSYEEQLAALMQQNARLEADRRSVMEHATTLLTQYQDLFTHSLEDKEHYHQEEKHFADKLNELRRQKEKLEEKIMDHYRKLDNSSSKKRGLGATLVHKVRKASTDLINKGRRGWNDDTNNRQSIVIRSHNRNGSESGENESDGSVDDRRGDESGGQFPHILKQQGAGTRQTVYYTEHTGDDAGGGGNGGGGGESGTSTLVILNRVTSVLTSAGAPPSSPSPSEDARRRQNKEPPVYYDYGCV